MDGLLVGAYAALGLEAGGVVFHGDLVELQMRQHCRYIWYHGTDLARAQDILALGFKPGTYFARDLAIALGMGGNHVFTVALPPGASYHGWERRLSTWLPPSEIRSYRIYAITKIMPEENANRDISEERIAFLESIGEL